jgi:hypothetical protein
MSPSLKVSFLRFSPTKSNKSVPSDKTAVLIDFINVFVHLTFYLKYNLNYNSFG